MRKHLNGNPSRTREPENRAHTHNCKEVHEVGRGHYSHTTLDPRKTMVPRPIGKNLPPEASESDSMAPNSAGRSPSASARCCLKRTLGTMMALGMLVLLPILGVGAFSGRHRGTPGSGLWASYFGGRQAAGGAGKCLVRAVNCKIFTRVQLVYIVAFESCRELLLLVPVLLAAVYFAEDRET